MSMMKSWRKYMLQNIWWAVLVVLLCVTWVSCWRLTEHLVWQPPHFPAAADQCHNNGKQKIEEEQGWDDRHCPSAAATFIQPILCKAQKCPHYGERRHKQVQEHANVMARSELQFLNKLVSGMPAHKCWSQWGNKELVLLKCLDRLVDGRHSRLR